MVRRFALVYIFMCVAFIATIVKMTMIVTIEREEWLRVSKSLQLKEREVKPERGNIYSSDGRLISTTIPYYALYMDTQVPALHEKNGKLYKENIDSLAICLSRKFGDKSPAGYRAMIDKAYSRGDGRLKLYPNRISYLDLQEVKQFPLFRKGRYKSGLIPEEFTSRENLYGSAARRTIGDIYGMGQGGQYGLELYYDSLLAGKPGRERGTRVGSQWIYVPTVAAEAGCDLVTTIDIEMQDVCESILRKKLEHIAAKSGCLVLMEVETGEIKAIVNLSRNGDGSYSESWNMAVADMSEPGSTFKTVSLAVALDNGVCDTSDLVDVHHGQYMFYNARMTDHNWKTGGYDTLSVAQSLAYSSNVGISRVINDFYGSRPSDFVDAVISSGFADDLHIEIPGATPPRIPEPSTFAGWSGVSLPWMSIGYVVQVPPIYTLNFYNAIANNGKMMRPYLVKKIIKDGEVVKETRPEVVKSSVCKTSTLRKVQGMLCDVVNYGTARRNQSKHFQIAGKTGTAQLGYGRGGVVKHQVTFCGYFPADKPMYSCIVVVKEPQMPPAAAFMSGDVFKQVAERVYAQKINKNLSDMPRYKPEEGEENLPRVKGGERKMVEQALRRAGVSYDSEGAAGWVQTIAVEDEVVAVDNPVLDNLVPNVVGMGADDALYLMERSGLYVQLYGRGRVISQSLQAGQPVVRGATVTLMLR